MRLLYNILFSVFFWLSAPRNLWKLHRRGGWRDKFGERFGRYGSKVKQALTNRQIVWFHAVSVGEVNLCTQLIRAVEEKAPMLKIVVSTTTTTGMAQLRSKLPAHIEKIYYPVDHRRTVQRAFAVVHPSAVVLVESEIWPNFLWRARQRQVPVFLVNARLSERSFRGYKRFAFLFHPLFASFAGVGAQNEEDRRRLAELGCRPEVIQVVGSLKYDAATLHDRTHLDVADLLRRLGVPEGAPVLVGGSTHDGEEELLARVFLRLRERFPDLFLVLVPRHFERGRAVGARLEALGIAFRYRSEFNIRSRCRPGSVQCLLVNTTGELRLFYEQATIVFVGKSLCAEGGQNPIEPAALGRPILFGPNMQNFAEISRAFIDGDGAIAVGNESELELRAAELLGDEARRTVLGENARQIVERNQGAVEQTASMILQGIEAAERETRTRPSRAADRSTRTRRRRRRSRSSRGGDD